MEVGARSEQKPGYGQPIAPVDGISRVKDANRWHGQKFGLCLAMGDELNQVGIEGGFEYQDRLPSAGRIRGRGAGLNPGNRFESLRLYVSGEAIDEDVRDCGAGRQIKTRLYRDRSRRVINRVAPSPDIPFDWSVNLYRGCEHGCVYCYARPGHEYLGFSCGLDFETKIVAKLDAPVQFRRELADLRWQGEPVVFAGVTDTYQPLEAKLRLARGCLEIARECGQPISIITKSALVTRDIDLLAPMSASGAARVSVSVTTLDSRLASAMEPRASSPTERLAAVKELSRAGIPVTVMAAPIIPGLNDQEIPALLEAAADAGASRADWIMLRLPYQIKQLFEDWVIRRFPGRASHVISLIRDVRGGQLSDSRFGVRMRGDGPRAEIIAKTFELYANRYGLNRNLAPLSKTGFRHPREPGDTQTLFAEGPE